MFYLYKWENLAENSPAEQTRNEWLYKYGAFARVNGLWFPCKILKYTTIGEPATILAMPLATVNADTYPKGEVASANIDVLYNVFTNGMSIKMYIREAMAKKIITDKMLTAGLRRSLNTEIFYGPKRLVRDMKKAANREDKEEIYIIPTNNKDEFGSLDLPRTIDIVEKLWNSNDWALQEISQLLGISYNPAHGKKERMVANELLGDRDLTIMNREMITQRLITAAEKFGEQVYHISSKVDEKDRNLNYDREGQSTQKVGEENV